jgi:DNA-binding IclR family transcriptional regulator
MNEKEAKVYLYLVEYGISGASEIAKHLGYPKSTVNFLADTLWNGGYLSKSIRSNTHYYEADIALLESLIERDRSEKADFLSDTLPLLREMNKNTHSKPKITFFD